MTDLTPIFNQCVSIVTQELSPSETKLKPIPYLIKDTFNKESRELYGAFTKINSFLTEIKPRYLSINYDEPGKLSVDDKASLDHDIQKEIFTLKRKIDVMQTYEDKRCSTIHNQKHRTWVSNVFGDVEKDMEELYFIEIMKQRHEIIKFFGICFKYTDGIFKDMVRKRQAREQQLNLLNFQNLEQDDINDEIVEAPVFDDFEPSNTMTQIQLQELKAENQDYLNLKSQQLEQAKNLYNSMIDITDMQSQINSALSDQESKIDYLINNQYSSTMDTKLGNKDLKSATARNKTGTNMIVYGAIGLGCFLLLVDYVS